MKQTIKWLLIVLAIIGFFWFVIYNPLHIQEEYVTEHIFRTTYGIELTHTNSSKDTIYITHDYRHTKYNLKVLPYKLDNGVFYWYKSTGVFYHPMGKVHVSIPDVKEYNVLTKTVDTIHTESYWESTAPDMGGPPSFY